MTQDQSQATPKARQTQRRPRKATSKSLENAALHYLNRYASSAENLRRLLRARVQRSTRHHDTDLKKGMDLVDQLIARLQSAGLLNDGDYARARARALHRRGAGLPAIRAKLRAKGVSRSDIEAALAAIGADTEESQLRAALNYARRRRIGPYRSETLRADHRDRDLAALARQGHSLDLCMRVIESRDLADLEREAGSG